MCIIKGISISKEKVAILVRGKDILTEIRNQGDFVRKEPWKEQTRSNGKLKMDINRFHYKNISKSKYLFDKQEYKESFKLLEKTICAIKKGKEYVSNDELKEFIEQVDFKKWRIGLYDFLTKLPNTDVNLKEWVDLANEVIRNNCFFDINDFEIKIKRGTNKIKFGQIFVDKELETEKYTLGTVHSVKGRTFEAVLPILKEKAYRNKKYVDIINENINDNEEKRILYVGITRPQKILVVAVPDSDKKVWVSKFYATSECKQKQLDLSVFTCTNLS
jgi:DNA helicase II / ATP-dependent DNA helicase PcrA